MNTIAPIPLVPADAPFSPEQRSWLNGFLAGLYGDAAAGGAAALAPGAAATEPAEEEDFPWHDPALAMDERLKLADGKPLKRRYMAAMAQLDCGQCGYLCQTYAEALAEGRETSFSLCVPGAKPTTKMLRALKSEAGDAPAAAVPAAAPAADTELPKAPPPTVHVRAAARLSGAGSAKDVRHVVIDLAGSGLHYEPGDSISLLPANDPALVAATVDALGADTAMPVACPDGITRPLGDALAKHADIGRPLDRTLDLLAMSARNAREAETLRRLAEGEDGEPTDPDLLDLLEAFPSARPPVAELVRSLPVLKPRLYSIASSIRAVPGEVHLCVSVVNGELRGRRRLGVASGFLGHHALDHGPIEAQIQVSHFRLPEDPETRIIMCGPGTGIAPFRAFLQEREALGHKGGAWLFFGEQTRAADFLFEREIEAWLANRTLSRLDVAFSRDQKAKIYVQDRMRENAADLWQWFQEGAHFFICGDASRMARDVDATLREIARSEGGLSEDEARDWIVALARQGRYKRDIY